MRKLALKSQFRLGTGLILLVVCIGTSLVVYSVGKQQVEADAVANAMPRGTTNQLTQRAIHNTG